MQEKKLMIESAGVCVSGGPMSATVVGEVCLGLAKDSRCYVTLVEVDDTAAFYLTEESIKDFLADPEEDPECEERIEELNTKHLIAAGEYEDFFAQPNEQWQQVFRYLIYLVRCEPDEEKQFLADTVGKPLDGDRIPLSDVEEEFRDDLL